MDNASVIEIVLIGKLDSRRTQEEPPKKLKDSWVSNSNQKQERGRYLIISTTSNFFLDPSLMLIKLSL